MRTLRHDPLVRTAAPLLVNIGTNGVLGVLYWIVAARLYDPATVASNAALVAAMLTLSGICQLNLGQKMPVLVPRAGHRGRQVVATVYAGVTAFTLVVLGVFVWLVLPQLSSLDEALGEPWQLGVFVLSVLAFNLFALQDAALISLRRQRVVPVENAAFGSAKLLLLFPLLAFVPDFGIFASWTVPLLVLVPVVSVLVFTRRPPPRTNAEEVVAEPVRRLFADYVGYLFLICSTFLLPVVALELLDPLEAAVFAIAWQTSATVDLVASNVGMALTVETAYGEDPVALRRTALRHGFGLVCVIAVLGVLATPVVLGLYGAHYRSEGVVALQLLFAAGIPRCLATYAVAEARAHRDVGFIVRLRAQNAVVALGLAWLLAPWLGLEGMALGWLVAQIASAAVAVRRLRSWSPASTRIPAGIA